MYCVALGKKFRILKILTGSNEHSPLLGWFNFAPVTREQHLRRQLSLDVIMVQYKEAERSDA